MSGQRAWLAALSLRFISRSVINSRPVAASNVRSRSRHDVARPRHVSSFASVARSLRSCSLTDWTVAVTTQLQTPGHCGDVTAVTSAMT